MNNFFGLYSQTALSQAAQGKGDDVTEMIRSALNRIILLLVAAGMISGLIYSAVFDESYDIVHGLSEYQNEMDAPSWPVMSDLIADSSSNADNAFFLSEKSRLGRPLITGIDDTAWANYKNRGIFFSVCLYIFFLCVLPGTSFKHIFYIHLKDGNK